MSVDSITNQIIRTTKELTDIEYKISLEEKKELENSNKILRIQKSITQSITPNILKSKQNQIQQINKMIINIKSKKTYLQKKESTKKCELLNLKKKLRREEDSLRKKIQQAEKKEQEKQLSFQKKLQTEINQVKQIKFSEDNQSLLSAEYDLFISHATEDKEDFVRPLAEALKNLGVRIWYDELTLKVGDSLREKIDQGLIKSKFGTIVLSSSFISKSWTKYELNSMVAKEMNGHKMILPIWHKVTKTDIINFSPALADKVALNTSINSIDEIAKELANVIQPT